MNKLKKQAKNMSKNITILDDVRLVAYLSWQPQDQFDSSFDLFKEKEDQGQLGSPIFDRLLPAAARKDPNQSEETVNQEQKDQGRGLDQQGQEAQAVIHSTYSLEYL